MSDLDLFALKAAEYGHIWNFTVERCRCGWTPVSTGSGKEDWGRWTDHVLEAIAMTHDE